MKKHGITCPRRTVHRKCCKNQHKGTCNFRLRKTTKKVEFELNVEKGFRMSLSQLGASLWFYRKMRTKAQGWKWKVVQREGSKPGLPQYKVQIRTWKEHSLQR